MAVLQNMREKFGIAISIIIALSLLYFIAPMDDLMTLFGRRQNVGEIAGKAVSYEDFLAEVDKQTSISEIMTGSSVKDEQQQQQIRNAAWQEFIDKFLFISNAKAAGIKVGDAELVERTTGEQASPVIAQNPIFMDQSGNFSSANVLQFVQNVQNDESGQLKTLWNYLQNTVNTQEYYAKYGALFNASSISNKLQEEREIALNNASANVDYVLAPYGYEKDSTITVSASQIKKFYKAHKENFRQIASRDIEYVVYEVTPSAADIAETSDKMNEAYDEFGTATNIKNFLLKNSDRQLSDYWYKAGELKTINGDIDDFIFGGGNGVSPIFQDKNSFFAARTVESAMISDSVYVKHILLQGENAKHLADSLLGVVKGGADFSALAAAYSADQSSVADGQMGCIGWLTQTYMIPGMESVITADINKPYVLDSRYGTHVVVVTKKTAPVAKKRVAILEKTTLPSKETFQENYNKVNKFAVLSNGTYEGYKKAVDSLGVYSHNLNITEATANYGAIEDAKEVTRKAFETKAGKATEIITVNQNYFFVVAVKEIHKEGYAPIKEVSPRIEQLLYAEARNAAKKAEIAAKVAGMTTLDEIAAALGTTVNAAQDINFSTMGYQAVEPAALGAMFIAKEGEIAGPVAGNTGIYMFKVNSREAGEFYTADDVKNMAQQKAQYSSQMIIPVMMQAGEVKDNRARYF